VTVRHHDLCTPVLAELRELFSREGSWIAHGDLSHYHWAQAENGDWVRPDHPLAVRWTLEAAIAKLTGTQQLQDLPPAVSLDQAPVRSRLLSKLVSDRLMAVQHVADDPRHLRAVSHEEGREGVLALIDTALAMPYEEGEAARAKVHRVDPPPVEVRAHVAPEPEPVPDLPDEVWNKPMGRRLPDGDYELIVPFDGEYRVQPILLAVNGAEPGEPLAPGLHAFKAGDVLTTDDLGHLHLIEEREPREVGRWFRFERDRTQGVRMTELHGENARDRATHRHLDALAAFMAG
jgi:hypothetical protein